MYSFGYFFIEAIHGGVEFSKNLFIGYCEYSSFGIETTKIGVLVDNNTGLEKN